MRSRSARRAEREPIEICEYPDSGKFAADAAPDGREAFGVVQRKGEDLDYWDGEA
jgi:hypothetical protein